jgi:alpha-N-arabinofuranosidase
MNNLRRNVMVNQRWAHVRAGRNRLAAVIGSTLAICCLLLVQVTADAADVPMPVLRIDVGSVAAHVSPIHAGLMTEEINHSYDGGLYAELVRDRALNGGVLPKVGALGPWSLIGSTSEGAGMVLDVNKPLKETVPASLRIDALSASPGHRVGVANEGFWGIPVRPDTHYRLSFYAKAVRDLSGPLTVSIERADGSATYGRVEVAITPGDWRKYEAVLVTTADIRPTANARLVIATEHPGAFSLTLVSLFPPTWNDRPNGNRIDLMQKLADLHPKFLRFPGGSYLNGATVDTRFDWKKTLGPVSGRPGHANTVWGYWSTDGIGLLEFLEWCEDLGMAPVLGVWAGQSSSGEVLPGPKLEPFIQDALDEIEYVSGDASTKWGARRTQDGHPAPFKLTYIEIGNEEAGPTYDARFAQFYDAIKSRYPSLKLIASSDMGSSESNKTVITVKSRVPDVLDQHYYMSAKDIIQAVGHYDHYDRAGPKIFVGEWATMEGSPTPNFQSALGDAAWMIGMERNSDVVIMQAYAPLLVNVNEGASQWQTNLIGYDALSSYGSPSYYAQVMFNANRGDEVLASTPEVAPGFFTSVTRDSETKTIYVKAVNTAGAPQTVKIEIAGKAKIAREGKALELAGNPDDVNSIQEPTKIVPVEQRFNNASAAFEHTFPKYSVTVLEIHTR